ncbi:hypothetical protein J6590_102264 [Homalodisca vitripennis]|nr:hypothetical protein J6590_102264 [Homalodisca vitripennis]
MGASYHPEFFWTVSGDQTETGGCAESRGAAIEQSGPGEVSVLDRGNLVADPRLLFLWKVPSSGRDDTRLQILVARANNSGNFSDNGVNHPRAATDATREAATFTNRIR